MANKARVNFSGDPEGSLSGIGHNTHDKMVLNAATFTSPPMTMSAYDVVVTAWDDKLALAKNRGKSEITAKNTARSTLEGALSLLGGYVNTVAQGDLATIELSGFPSYDTKHPQSSGGVTYVPQNARIDRGDVSGSVVVRWQGDGTKAMYEVQVTTGDPNAATGWTYKGSFSGGRADLNGFTAGATLWARVRKIGTGGDTGDWSDPATIMVT